MGINSLWNLLAAALVKAKSLNRLRRMSQTTPSIYISIKRPSHGQTLRRAFAKQQNQQQWGQATGPAKLFCGAPQVFYIMTWFLGSYVAMFVNIKL